MKEFTILANKNNSYLNENDSLFRIVTNNEDIYRIDELIKPLSEEDIEDYNSIKEYVTEIYMDFFSLEKGEEKELENIIIYRDE